MPTAHMNTAGVAHPRLLERAGAGRCHKGAAAAQVAGKALSSCTNAAPGMMGARGAQLLPLLLAPIGTTWSRTVAIQEGGEQPALWSGSRVWPPPPTRVGRLRQELMAAPHPADLAGINLTIYTHANQL